MKWIFPTKEHAEAVRLALLPPLDKERSIGDHAAMDTIRSELADKTLGLALQPAVVWWDRIQLLRFGSYEDRKGAVYDSIRLSDYLGTPREMAFKQHWVHTFIHEAARGADISFFKQFGKQLQHRPQQKQLTEYSTLDVFLIDHWAETRDGLPELCSLAKSGLLTAIRYQFPILANMEGLSETTLRQRCYRTLGLPTYQGKKMLVSKPENSQRLHFTKPDGTSFVYPDPNYRRKGERWGCYGISKDHVLTNTKLKTVRFQYFQQFLLARSFARRRKFDTK